MSEIKNGGLDQYGAEPFEQHQFGTAGVERVNPQTVIVVQFTCIPADRCSVGLLGVLRQVMKTDFGSQLA